MYRTLTFLIFLTSFTCWSQLDPTKKYSVNTVAFYNVENLFDIENDPEKNDDEFAVGGKKNVTPEVYKLKIKQSAEVLRDLNVDVQNHYCKELHKLQNCLNHLVHKLFQKFLHHHCKCKYVW